MAYTFYFLSKFHPRYFQKTKDQIQAFSSLTEIIVLKFYEKKTVHETGVPKYIIKALKIRVYIFNKL